MADEHEHRPSDAASDTPEVARVRAELLAAARAGGRHFIESKLPASGDVRVVVGEVVGLWAGSVVIEAAGGRIIAIKLAWVVRVERRT